MKRILQITALMAFIFPLIACTNKSDFEKTFKIKPPVGIQLVHEGIIIPNPDFTTFRYFGEYKADPKNFHDLTNILELKKRPIAYIVLPDPNTREIESWWNPPKFEELDSVEMYERRDADSSIIAMQYFKGTIYIYAIRMR